MISTLRNYIEVMDGRLSLIVEFPDRMPVHLSGLGDVEEPASSCKDAHRS